MNETEAKVKPLPHGSVGRWFCPTCGGRLALTAEGQEIVHYRAVCSAGHRWLRRQVGWSEWEWEEVTA